MLQVEVTIKSDCECRRESTTNCTNPNCETIPLCTYENRISDEMVCAGAKGKGGTKVYVFFLASRAATGIFRISGGVSYQASILAQVGHCFDCLKRGKIPSLLSYFFFFHIILSYLLTFVANVANL